MKTLNFKNYNDGVEFFFNNSKEEMKIINFIVDNNLSHEIIKTEKSFRKSNKEDIKKREEERTIENVYIENLNKMRSLYKNKELNPLRISELHNLKGKKIETIYFGYEGQDGYDTFIVGNMKKHVNKERLFTEDGRNTYIYENGSFLVCSDDDRIVHYRVYEN